MSIVGIADQLAAAAQQAAAGRERRADLVLLAARDAAAVDQRRLRRRPTHVERDRILVAEPLRQRERSDDAGCRARLERVDGALRGVGGAHRAARALHDRSGASIPLANRSEIVRHQGPDVGVHDRGRGALVLLLLAQDLARERDRDAG